MLENLRANLFLKALQNALKKHHRPRRPQTLDSAASIGILFDATLEKKRREIQDYALTLEKKGKKVHLFGFFNTKQPPAEPPFGHFSQKDLKFSGEPRVEKIAPFLEKKLDLLICLNPDELRPIAWTAAFSQAGMKIGLPTGAPNDYDLLLETGADKGIRDFADQASVYLDKLVLKT